MPFGLKNTGATYQRSVDHVFRKQIGRSLEVYVDDIVIKSRTHMDFAHNLEETLHTLQYFGLKLNPLKCSFGVKSGKFLGYQVSREGLRVNPDKVQNIMELRSPKTIKEVQRLVGSLITLSRFLFKVADKQLPFFRALKRIKNFEWNDDYEEAFRKLKVYLADLPILSTPHSGEVLYLYLAASEDTISSVLILERTVQEPIYFVSRTLHDAESRYPPLEKLVLALLFASRRHDPNFQAHTIRVLSTCDKSC